MGKGSLRVWWEEGREDKDLLPPTVHRLTDSAFHPRPCSAHPSGHGTELSILYDVYHTALTGNGQASTCSQGSLLPQLVLPGVQFCIPFPVYQEVSRPGPLRTGFGGPHNHLYSVSSELICPA